MGLAAFKQLVTSEPNLYTLPFDRHEGNQSLREIDQVAVIWFGLKHRIKIHAVRRSLQVLLLATKNVKQAWETFLA